jgi:catechol 2,3-dioxygenase-like lactoylglutathione lyase family enzyme
MMEKKSGKQAPFSTLHHIAVVVKDIDRAVKFYTSIGIGPFKDYPPLKEYVKINVPDEIGFHNLKMKIAQIGPIELQLIEPGEGKTIHKDFLEKKGEGVYHLGFVVDNVDRSEAEVTKQGLKVIASGRREDGSGFSYLDTVEKAGVTLLIRQSPPRK